MESSDGDGLFPISEQSWTYYEGCDPLRKTEIVYGEEDPENPGTIVGGVQIICSNISTPTVTIIILKLEDRGRVNEARNVNKKF